MIESREYLVECDHVTGAVWSPAYLFVDESVAREVVRCRDCKQLVKRGRRLYCDLNAGGFPEVEPDGFCAWGERRDG